jgi:hypothetical protein
MRDLSPGIAEVFLLQRNVMRFTKAKNKSSAGWF